MTRTHERHPDFLHDQRAFFDQLITEDRDTYFDPQWDATRRFELSQLFARVSARRVIDIGCGIGFHDVVLVEDHGVEEVLAIDYSPRSVETAEETYPHDRVRREVADVFELEPADFDLAVSFQVIEHLTRPLEFLEACARQVRPAGHVAVFTPNRMRLDNRVRRIRGKPPLLADPQHFREYTARELRAMGSGVGLTPVAAFGYGLSFTLPRIGRQLVPRRWGLHLGAGMAPVADGVGVVFRRVAA